MNHGLLSFGNSNFHGFDGLKLANVKTRVINEIDALSLWLPTGIETKVPNSRFVVKDIKAGKKVKISLNFTLSSNSTNYFAAIRLYKNGKQIMNRNSVSSTILNQYYIDARIEFTDLITEGNTVYEIFAFASAPGNTLRFRYATDDVKAYCMLEEV